MIKKFVIFGFALGMVGCSGAKVKRQIGEELGRLVQAQDCQTNCEMIKLYIKTHLQ